MRERREEIKEELHEIRDELRRDVRSTRETVLTFLKWLVVAGVTGVVGGAAGTMFHASVLWAAQLRSQAPWLIWLLPVGGLMIAAFYRVCRMKNENTNTGITLARSQCDIANSSELIITENHFPYGIMALITALLNSSSSSMAGATT